jgi:hypothetical protein
VTIDLNTVLILAGFVSTMFTLSFKLGGSIASLSTSVAHLADVLESHDARIQALEARE